MTKNICEKIHSTEKMPLRAGIVTTQTIEVHLWGKGLSKTKHTHTCAHIYSTLLPQPLINNVRVFLLLQLSFYHSYFGVLKARKARGQTGMKNHDFRVLFLWNVWPSNILAEMCLMILQPLCNVLV